MTNQPVIQVHHLDHYFGSGQLRKQALFDIDLEISAGEIVIMTGPSGSGKTTLLTLMGGLRSAQSGSLVVLGKELCGAKQDALVKARRSNGYIFQAHNLHGSLSALDNVQMGLEVHGLWGRQARRQQAQKMLEQVGLGDRINNRPSQLSGGQQQRVAIARALVNEPALLLAAEPTGALDSQTSKEVMELFNQLNSQDITIVIITHETEVAEQAKRQIRIQDGLVVA